jgi:ELWxxDGT repeat protein
MRKAKIHRRALRPFRRLIAEPLEPRLPLTVSPQLLADINSGAVPSTPGPATVIGSTAYFAATTSAGGTELWKTDGTPAGTVLVKDIFPGPSSSNPRFLTNVNGTLLIRANDGVHGDEVWKSDGTDVGTMIVADVAALAPGSYPSNFLNVNGSLYFTASSDSTGSTTYYGPSPYLSAADSPFDLSQLGTNFWLEDFEDGQLNTPGVSASFGAPRNPSSLTDSVDADDGTIDGGGHLGHSFLVRPEAPGVTFTFDRQALVGLPSYVGLVVTGGDPAYPDNNVDFFDAGGNLIGTRTDSFPKPISGVTSDDRFVGAFHAGGISSVRVSGPLGIGNSAFELDHLQYGVVVQPVGTMALYRLDSNFNSDLIEDLGYQPNFRAASIGNVLYFTGNDATGGIELWKTSVGGTSQVMDINPGPASSNPRALMNVSGTLYFSANDGDNGDELWKSDGTTATLVKDIRPGSASSNVGSLTNVNGILMFSATDGTSGNELWRSDGTQNGTVLVSDIKSGSSSSSPQSFANVNGSLFFVADDGTHFFELWKSDGTTVGTVLIKDIWPGDHTSNANSLSNIAGTLIFAASDGQTGAELWQSDGTAVGTIPAPDISSGALDSSPQNFRKLGNTVIFSADDGVHGRELWTARLVSAAGTIGVDGKANIFGAGHSAPPGAGPGILPTGIDLPAGQNRSMQFSVTGQVSFDITQPDTRPYYDSDGRPEASYLYSTGGISGIRADTYGFLVGVFLGPDEPADPAPPTLDFRSASNFTQLTPLLNQTFFIGDALTSNAAGDQQSFLVPSGATRLYLGFADTYDPDTNTITGPPQYYDDNGGQLQVAYELQGTPINAAPTFIKGPDISVANGHRFGPTHSVVTFDGFKGLTGDGEPFDTYTENGFTVASTHGAWQVMATSSPTPTAIGNPPAGHLGRDVLFGPRSD